MGLITQASRPKQQPHARPYNEEKGKAGRPAIGTARRDKHPAYCKRESPSAVRFVARGKWVGLLLWFVTEVARTLV